MEAKLERISLHGMIRLDQVEDLLNRLVAKIDSQQQEINQLKALTRSFITEQACNDQYQRVNLSLEALNQRIASVQVAAMAQIGSGKQIPSGELSFANSLQIQQLARQVDDCIRRKDVEEHVDKLATKHDADIKAIYSYAAPRTVLNVLQGSHMEMGDRLNSVESLLACKVDQSEIGNIRALIRMLEHYDEFRNSATESLENLNSSLGLLLTDVDRLRQQELALERIQASMNDDLKKAALRSECRAIAKQVVDIENLLKTKAEQVHLNQTNESLKAARDKVDDAHNRLGDVDIRLAELVSLLAEKASLSDLRACVLRTHFDRVITALGTSLDTKAESNLVKETVARVTGLEKRADDESIRISVAVRFVEWFTSRGVLYEHNMRVIDKHLDKLSSAAMPSNRSPYLHSTRFSDVSSLPHMNSEAMEK